MCKKAFTGLVLTASMNKKALETRHILPELDGKQLIVSGVALGCKVARMLREKLK